MTAVGETVCCVGSGRERGELGRLGGRGTGQYIGGIYVGLVGTVGG